MRAIHGGKSKNDRIDSEKIAVLLRGGMIPQSYVYPKRMRSTRDVMRRRTHFVRKRAELLTHIQMTRTQYNLPAFGKKIAYKANRSGVAEQFPDPSVRMSVQADCTLLDHYDALLNELECYINRQGKIHDPDAYRILRSIGGVGKILALTILYEIDTIERFPRVQDFLSYARLVKAQKESAGKPAGHGGGRIGNVHLKWAFSEAVLLLLRQYEPAKKRVAQLERKHGKAKALGILSAKLGRAVYFMLKNKRSFRTEAFFGC
jgi:transposase